MICTSRKFAHSPFTDACDRKDASDEIVRLLLEAEDRYIAYRVGDGYTDIKRRYVNCY